MNECPYQYFECSYCEPHLVRLGDNVKLICECRSEVDNSDYCICAMEREERIYGRNDC